MRKIVSIVRPHFRKFHKMMILASYNYLCVSAESALYKMQIIPFFSAFKNEPSEKSLSEFCNIVINKMKNALLTSAKVALEYLTTTAAFGTSGICYHAFWTVLQFFVVILRLSDYKNRSGSQVYLFRAGPVGL